MPAGLIRIGDGGVKDCMMTYAASIARFGVFPRPVHGRLRSGVLMQSPDLNRLLRQVAEEKDRAAFQYLFEHFAPRIKAYLIRLGAGSQVAEDLAQEAMLMLWRKAALFDPAKASASTWIFTIARNLRIDMARRERRLRFDPEGSSLMPAAECNAEENLQISEKENSLRQALRILPPDQTEIVMLSFFSDKPHSQIAAELGIPLGTVKSRLRLAMARLRTALGGEKP
jgi:RNA polymerase sigma-70 factor (ECF subfamily)